MHKSEPARIRSSACCVAQLHYHFPQASAALMWLAHSSGVYMCQQKLHPCESKGFRGLEKWGRGLATNKSKNRAKLALQNCVLLLLRGHRKKGAEKMPESLAYEDLPCQPLLSANPLSKHLKVRFLSHKGPINGAERADRQDSKRDTNLTQISAWLVNRAVACLQTTSLLLSDCNPHRPEPSIFVMLGTSHSTLTQNIKGARNCSIIGFGFPIKIGQKYMISSLFDLFSPILGGPYRIIHSCSFPLHTHACPASALTVASSHLHSDCVGNDEPQPLVGKHGCSLTLHCPIFSGLFSKRILCKHP